jgi:peroxiredoxin
MYNVCRAWSAHLAPSGTPIHFIADDAGTFVSAIGLAFDGTHLLGGTRAKVRSINSSNIDQ